MKILHIGNCDKFLPPFIDKIKENFNFEQHEFLLTAGMGKTKNIKNVTVFKPFRLKRIKYYLSVLFKMHSADKVFLHGLFDIRLVLILFLTPWLLKKCYWVIWGGDLYAYKFGNKNKNYKIKEFFRRPVIKRIGHLVTYIQGDVELARKWYGTTGKYHECIMYTSNLYTDYTVPPKKGLTLNIQVGNSADPSNNHIEVLEKLLPFKDQDISIYVPLSYGDQVHAKKVIKQGKEWFGENFKPLTDFIPFEQYLKLLGTIDITIFNHKRQQAMGNTITLLGLGKTVYLRSDVTQWQFFQDKGIVVGDFLKFKQLEKIDCKNNEKKIKEYFSEINFLNQLKGLFQ